MWIEELDILRENYLEYKDERTRLMNGDVVSKKKVVSKGAVVKKSVKKALVQEE